MDHAHVADDGGSRLYRVSIGRVDYWWTSGWFELRVYFYGDLSGFGPAGAIPLEKWMSGFGGCFI